MNIVVVVIVAIVILAIFVFGRLWLQRVNANACPDCCYPKHRCECNNCKHTEIFTPRWSQDGWVSRCKVCADVVYLGDDFDGGPKR